MRSAVSDPRSLPAWALRALLCGTVVVTLDFFAVNVALATIREELGATTAQLQWIVATYGLVFGAGLLVGSRLGDRMGHERAFVLGTGLYALASLFVAWAPTPTLLIGARVLQGAGAAALSPQVLSLINMQADPRRREQAFAGYGIALGLGSGLGQLVGALLITYAAALGGWRAIFVLNALLAGCAGGAIASRRLTSGNLATSLEPASVTWLILSFTALLVPLIEGRRLHWPAWTFGLLAVACIMLFGLARYQRSLQARGRAALVPLSVFDTTTVQALGTVLCFYASVSSFFLIISLTLRSAYGLTPLAAAGAFCVMVAGFLATTFGARPLATRWGPRPIRAGAWLAVAGHLMLAGLLGRNAALVTLLPALLVTGAGLGLLMGPLIGRAVGTVRGVTPGLASGLVGSAQWLGNSLGVALVGTLYFGLSQHARLPLEFKWAAAASHLVFAAISLTVALQLARWLPSK